MNITTLKKVLPLLVTNNICPWIWGHHGKGKTETIENFYKENGWLVFNFRLNCMSDVGDFLGLQEIQKATNGDLISSKFCMPDWLKAAIDFCKDNPGKRAGIFLDEINRAARLDLVGPVFQMSLSKMLHTYDFSMYNIDIMVASNPNTKDYSTLNLKDKALMSRFCHINFDPTKKEFLTYAEKKIDKTLYDFLSENPEFIEEKDVQPFSISDFAKPDRRKWVNGVAKVHEADLTENEKMELLTGLVGLEAAMALQNYKKTALKPITLEEILDKYNKVRDSFKNIVEKSERSDLVNHSVSKVIEHLQSEAKLTLKQGKNVLAFIEDLPNEHMWNVLHSSYNNKNFFDFCQKKEIKDIIERITDRCEKVKETLTKESK